MMRAIAWAHEGSRQRAVVKSILRVSAISAVWLIASCDPYWQFAHDERISGPYRLQAVDVLGQMEISYADGQSAVQRIPATVFAVGFDGKYITAAAYKYDYEKGSSDHNKEIGRAHV